MPIVWNEPFKILMSQIALHTTKKACYWQIFVLTEKLQNNKKEIFLSKKENYEPILTIINQLKSILVKGNYRE